MKKKLIADWKSAKTIEDYFYIVSIVKREQLELLRKFALQKTCQECGAGEVFLQVHHLKYPAICLDDVTTVCRECHYKKHAKQRADTITKRREQREFLISQERFELTPYPLKIRGYFV